MIREGLNMENIKQRNRKIILETIEQFGTMSRKDLSTQLKLTQATLTLITTEMLKENLLQEVGKVNENKVGRKKILIDINYNSRYVIGINFEKNETVIALTNLKGDILKLLELKKFEKESQLELYSKKIEEIIKEKKIDYNLLIGIGIGIYGHVNPNEGIVNINEFNINLVEYFRNRFKKKVVIDNNVRALALSETFFNKELKYFLFIKYGPGIGSSIVFNKEILYGNNYSAGEIGHIIMNNKGLKCNVCNKSGCLENYINFENIKSKIKEISKEYPESLISKKRTISIQDILEAGEAGEIFIINELKEIASLISKAVLNLLTVMDFEKIVVYGEIFNNNFFKEILLESLKNHDENFKESKLEISKNKHFPKNLGGVFLAIKHIFYEKGGCQ